MAVSNNTKSIVVGYIYPISSLLHTSDNTIKYKILSRVNGFIKKSVKTSSHPC